MSNSGLLADPTPTATYDYGAAPKGLLRRATRMRDLAEGHGVPLRAGPPLPLRPSRGLLGTRRGAVGGPGPGRGGAVPQALPGAVREALREQELLPAGVPIPEGSRS
ncbi:hypothetical protein ACFV2X_07840 [Streptomyces sp. NPDC059679]|uniref:hypothetical protein n=1 Tax=Streptomyces sp. NPDC059679 TaxID=3346903 RepID=UPI0036D062B5